MHSQTPTTNCQRIGVIFWLASPINDMIRLSPTPASSDSGGSSAALPVRGLQHLTKNKQFVCQGTVSGNRTWPEEWVPNGAAVAFWWTPTLPQMLLHALCFYLAIKCEYREMRSTICIKCLSNPQRDYVIIFDDINVKLSLRFRGGHVFSEASDQPHCLTTTIL